MPKQRSFQKKNRTLRALGLSCVLGVFGASSPIWAGPLPNYASSSDDRITQLTSTEERNALQHDGICEDMREALAQNFREKVFNPLFGQLEHLPPPQNSLTQQVLWQGSTYRVSISGMPDGHVTEPKIQSMSGQELSLRDEIETKLKGLFDQPCRHDNTPENIYLMTEVPQNQDPEVVSELRAAQDIMNGAFQATNNLGNLGAPEPTSAKVTNLPGKRALTQVGASAPSHAHRELASDPVTNSNSAVH